MRSSRHRKTLIALLGACLVTSCASPSLPPASTAAYDQTASLVPASVTAPPTVLASAIPASAVPTSAIPKDTTGAPAGTATTSAITDFTFWELHGEPLFHINEQYHLISQFDLPVITMAARVVAVTDAPKTIPDHSQLTLEDRSGQQWTLLLPRAFIATADDARRALPSGWQAWVLAKGPAKLPGETSTAHCVSYRYCAFALSGNGFRSLLGSNQEIESNPQIEQLVSSRSVDELARTLPNLKGWDWSVISTYLPPPTTG